MGTTTAGEQPIINILSTSYAGSTILARWLSQLEGVVAVGEAKLWMFKRDRIPAERTHRACSCGRSMESCPLWEQDPGNYNELFAAVRSLGYDIVVDSTKHYPKPGVNVFIYKTPLELYWSIRKRKRRGAFKKMLQEKREEYRKWRMLKKSGYRYVAVRFQDFRRNPHRLLRQVSEMTGRPIDYQEKAHIALSNKSKYGPLKIR